MIVVKPSSAATIRPNMPTTQISTKHKNVKVPLMQLDKTVLFWNLFDLYSSGKLCYFVKP